MSESLEQKTRHIPSNSFNPYNTDYAFDRDSTLSGVSNVFSFKLALETLI